MTETILVVVVVGAAAAWASRSIWRSVRGGGKGKCSGCAGSNDCSASTQPTNLVELGKMDSCGPGTNDCYVPPAPNDKK